MFRKTGSYQLAYYPHFQVAFDHSEAQGALGNRTAEKRRKNRLALTAVFVCHSGKKGTALRDDGDEKKTGNFWNLLWLAGRYNKDINTYLTSESTTKFLSLEIQNKLLKIFCQTVLRKLIATIKMNSEILASLCAIGNNTTKSYVFSFIADETSHKSNEEQESIRIRYCANSFHSEEAFLKLPQRM